MANGKGLIRPYTMLTAEPVDEQRRALSYALLLADALAFVGKDRYVTSDPDAARNGWYDCLAVSPDGVSGTWQRRLSASGSTGAAGPIGPVGTAGPIGPAGLAGPAGAPGAAGAIGPAGSVGPAGAAGTAGAAGNAGAAGTPGAAGARGLTGDLGPQGGAGLTGPQGVVGEPGARGAAGATGPGGAQGPAGEIGLSGATGAAGPAGPIGSDILISATDPAAIDGQLNDLSINSLTGDYFKKTAGTPAWVKRGNLGVGPGPASPGTSTSAGIDVTAWSNADVTAVYTEANWSAGRYTGPPLSTGPYKRRARVPTATVPGYLYETHPITGSGVVAVIRIALNA